MLFLTKFLVNIIKIKNNDHKIRQQQHDDDDEYEQEGDELITRGCLRKMFTKCLDSK